MGIWRPLGQPSDMWGRAMLSATKTLFRRFGPFALTGSGSKGNQVAHINLAPAARGFALGGGPLFQRKHHQRAHDDRAKDQNGPHLLAHDTLLSTQVDTYTSHPLTSRKIIRTTRRDLAGCSQLKPGKTASIGHLPDQSSAAVAPRGNTSEMEAHRLEAFSCQTIQIPIHRTTTCTGVTASAGAACSLRCLCCSASLSFWRLSDRWAGQGTARHLRRMSYRQPPKRPCCRPNNPTSHPNTASGGRRMTSAFCVSATPNGACPC
mmetsp:Transcript_29513/g.57935  ORF Transcript_29513/g.57935 Transcript_29513/m.57935 type:complete len:263 (-) Transcript_29513:1259-2047(-)